MDGSLTWMRCRRCNAPWSGATLLIGTMYSYDVFAATPCCDARLECKQCHQSVFNHGTTPAGTPSVAPPLKYYSDYSRRVKCQHCSVEDYHFVKPLDELYDMNAARQQPQQSVSTLPRIWSTLYITALLTLYSIHSLYMYAYWCAVKYILTHYIYSYSVVL